MSLTMGSLIAEMMSKLGIIFHQMEPYVSNCRIRNQMKNQNQYLRGDSKNSGISFKSLSRQTSATDPNTTTGRMKATEK